MRAPVRRLPCLLRNRSCEQVVEPLLGERLQATGGRARQGGGRPRPQNLFERILELGAYVHVRVHLGDEEVGHLGADGVMLEQLAARLGPVFGVQQLAVGPDGEDRVKAEARRDDDQGDRDPASSSFGRRRR